MHFISTQSAPQAIGPYSQAIISNGFLFSSGQIALDPMTMQIVEGGIEAQTKRVLANLEAVLKEAKTSKEKVVKTTLFLKNMNDFAIVNKIYEEFFASHKPARSTVEVARLPKDVLIEIECVAEV
ncbi:MAG: hypothetical protein UR28_C0025G0004 [Candidatus Peregrinibacteria bacterium GW2011_GWF2_33_10]|nr:MAG: hypothetical protein UR28_C0025G0004 [Candidatus Peregrinibacteria bacterium GW2011_GWF2_33_10]OGJ45583.1 MAG: hypothetical protein A2263_00570 [Candidatus Peregrinibacteria bacterium RIFOXYA2_FULL_33_21]OGJ45961.1 MAG: hypothetical protein A2272_04425 [Candidatus Peregrinibacteria bacterium RIFOXYA12_FULL_33_12]OGJ51088.1 MAG: hypothetical protein A2307_06440 [Candidatus Peregrinibacteria bacterium RIFOXYB2_FULL_33_20]